MLLSNLFICLVARYIVTALEDIVGRCLPPLSQVTLEMQAPPQDLNYHMKSWRCVGFVEA